MPDSTPLSWTNDLLAEPNLDAFYKANQENREAAEKNRRATARNTTILSIGGIVIGLLGMLSATITHIKTPVAEPPKYIPFDSRTAWFGEATNARDLPKLYTANTREAALRTFIIACESYIPQTWASIDYHSCALFSTPAEQRRREALNGMKDSPEYPPNMFKNGWAMPDVFPKTGFVKTGETGTDPTKVYESRVRYQRTELSSTVSTENWYTAIVTFTFRPDLKMSDEDRRINPTGLQVINLIRTRD